MAQISRRRQENVPGDFYVDESCIDCDTCRWMAPSVFHEAGGRSAVHHQPAGRGETRRALEALVACPTASIGVTEPHPELKAVSDSFPIPVDGPVHHCGYHSESSFGAASYLVVRPEGNVLVDSPRFAAPLVRRIEALGGVKWMFLTHRDDVADHERFAKRFGCTRVLHADDVTGDTRGVERRLEGRASVELEPGLEAVPVPGHTQGHAVLLVDGKYLFTGDHLAYSERRDRLIAFRRACWYDWGEQTESMRRLLDYRFEWVLPGHGRRHHASAEEMHRKLEACVAWMQTA